MSQDGACADKPIEDRQDSTCNDMATPISSRSRLLDLPAEIHNEVVRFYLASNPIVNAGRITRVNKLLRELWAPVLCTNVGPIRVDGYADAEVLRLLNHDGHKKKTKSLTIYYDATVSRTIDEETKMHRDFTGLTEIYLDQDALETLVVHPGILVDTYFERIYHKFSQRLPGLKTLVIPATLILNDGSSDTCSTTKQAPFSAVVRTRSVTGEEKRQLYLRFNGYLHTAHQFLSLPGHTVHEISLFGHDGAPLDWEDAYDVIGFGSFVDANRVELHRLEGSQLGDLRLGGNVESLRICNPRDDYLDEDDISRLLRRFVAQKIGSSNTRLAELHLVSDITDSDQEVLWVPESLFAHVMDNITDLWALSVHQQDIVPYNIWTYTHVHHQTLRALSLRQSDIPHRDPPMRPAPLVYDELEDIARELPNLEGLALDIALFPDLHFTDSYEDSFCESLRKHGRQFWESLKTLRLKVLLIFVEQLNEEIESEEEAQNIMDVFGTTLQDFLGEWRNSSLETVHFVFRNSSMRGMHEALARKDYAWSYRVTDSTVDSFPLRDLNTEEQKMFLALCGRKAVAEEQVEEEEIGEFSYTAEKYQRVREYEREKASLNRQAQVKRRKRATTEAWSSSEDESSNEHKSKRGKS